MYCCLLILVFYAKNLVILKAEARRLVKLNVGLVEIPAGRSNGLVIG